jgi:hypothetical protein
MVQIINIVSTTAKNEGKPTVAIAFQTEVGGTSKPFGAIGIVL